ncbi:MAG: HD domain-containing protein [Bacteroidetes bacterium]|nr:HD domain-containing protein [Bacteroidota bacterium]
MNLARVNKRKIFNDPVYGFIPIESELTFDIIEQPCFQRLRRIKQLGLTHLVYPGALHTRFHHSMGAMYLMGQVIAALRNKGIGISDEETLSATIAILLHDIGHGPFSHSLEHSILDGINHEQISRLYMERLNEAFNGSLEEAISIFNNSHPKAFLHQLVSSQLDVDRMDYLRRDSFYTGVSEGVINTERIIKMLTIAGGKIAVEEKGIYSVEKYIIARRLMYWQVYLHKTVVAAESMLNQILKRAKFLARQGEELFATPSFAYFLTHPCTLEDLKNNPDILEIFSQLDDFDILTSVKVWTKHHDKVLSMLSEALINRHLFRTELSNIPAEPERIQEMILSVCHVTGLTAEEAAHFVIHGSSANYAYHPKSDKINIVYKNGDVVDIARASEQLNISVLLKNITKYFICAPKWIPEMN